MPPAKAQVITTIAGKLTPGFSGDGGPAVNAYLNVPLGICLDAKDNLYIADTYNQRIRKIDAETGIITTIAGNGTKGFSGDGGPALNASFNDPWRLAIDKSNNLYVVDRENFRIRKINLTTNIITTIAGDGTEHYINGGLAINSGMLPEALAFDKSGNLFISQHAGNFVSYTTNIISRIDMRTGIITTFAGTGQFTFNGDGLPALSTNFYNPCGICFDSKNNLFIAESTSFRIRKVDAVSGRVSTVAGAGGTYNPPDGTPVSEVGLKNPLDVFADPNDDLIITDENNCSVMKIDMHAGVITTLAGNGYYGQGEDCVPPTSSILADPVVAVLDKSGNLYFTEIANHRIRKVIQGNQVEPTILISADSTAVCENSTVRFKAMVNNSNSINQYQWTVNGIAAGTNSAGFSSNTFLNNDAVQCLLTTTASGNCASVNNAPSNTITIKVSPYISPAITISSNADAICSGSTVNFNASAVNTGINASYQWMLNGNITGNNSPSYSTNSLSDKDTVSCALLADRSQKCMLSDHAVSNSIIMHVSKDTLPSVSISSSATEVCYGTPVTFKASVKNGGASPVYRWQLNNIDAGANEPSFTTGQLKQNDKVSCIVTATGNACGNNESNSSNSIEVAINPLPQIYFAFTDTIIAVNQSIQLEPVISGNVTSFQWYPASMLADPFSLHPVTTPLQKSTKFDLTAITDKGCSGSAGVTVKVFTKLYMPNAFTPNGDGRNDVFRIPPATGLQLEALIVFDRWGKKLFQTADIGKGWDGTYNGYPCSMGSYVFILKGNDSNGKIFTSGTVTLIR